MYIIQLPALQGMCNTCKFKNEDDYGKRNKAHCGEVIECKSYIKKKGKVE